MAPARRVANSLNRWPKPAILALGLAAMGLISVIDHSTWSDISFSILYLVPMAFAAWFAGLAWSMPLWFIGAWLSLRSDFDGERMYTHALSPYLNSAIRLGFYAGVSRLAALLRKAQDQHEEDAGLKSKMLSLVSHEFGNSLATLYLSFSMLEFGENKPVPEDRKRYYDMLRRLYHHLQSAVANFLNLNRMESGRFRLNLRPASVRPLVEETVSLLGPLADQQGIKVAVDIPADLAPARADPDALGLVLSNLIGNAIKYTRSGGKVSVRAWMEGEKRRIVVSIQDNGIGVAKEDREKIFSGFYRGEAAQTAGKGFGIGLAVSSEILDSHGSKLELESEPEKGTRFFFALPEWRDSSGNGDRP